MAQTSSTEPPSTGQRAYRQQRPLVLEVSEQKPMKAPTSKGRVEA